MKKKISILGIIALVAVIGFTIIAACGGDGGSPSAVARKAIEAIEKGDAKGVEATFTPEAAAMVIPMLEKAQGQYSEKKGIDKTEETIDGDKATVKVTYNDGSTDDITLVKVDGKWKCSIEK